MQYESINCTLTHIPHDHTCICCNSIRRDGSAFSQCTSQNTVSQNDSSSMSAREENLEEGGISDVTEGMNVACTLDTLVFVGTDGGSTITTT